MLNLQVQMELAFYQWMAGVASLAGMLVVNPRSGLC